VSSNSKRDIAAILCGPTPRRLPHPWCPIAICPTTAGVNYTYDGDGNRVEKSNGKIYWYGAGTEILDESDPSGNITAEYVFFGGKRVALRTVSSGAITYYAEDFLGTSRMMLTSSGTVCYDADFYPFGGERAYTNTCSQNYKFEGKERDTETNNDDFGARYYASVYGRFLSVDPVKVTPGRMGDPQQLNLYGLVRNNPLRFLDPDGETLEATGDIDAIIESLSSILGPNSAGRVQFDQKTNTITVDLTGIDLSHNEGASLLNNVVSSSSIYSLTVGNSIQTAGGSRPLKGDDSILNLDNAADWRYGNGKSPNDLPAGKIADQIGINPKDAVFRDQGHIVPLSSLIFHELAEAYAKIDEHKQYVNKDGSPGAHDEAAQREMTLRSQRPNMQLEGRAGAQLIRDPKPPKRE